MIFVPWSVAGCFASSAGGGVAGLHKKPPGLLVRPVALRGPRTGVFQNRPPTQEHEERPCGSRREVLGAVAGSLVVACASSPFNVHASLGTSIDPLLQNQIEIQRVTEHPPTHISAPGRIVAIGDLHGDVLKTIRSLELARVLELDDRGKPVWCGGNTTLVQLGDVLDRGDCEIGILMLLKDLQQQAEEDGGALYMLNGNHETMNICGNFRYVTRGAFYESALAAGLSQENANVWDQQLIARVALYSPGGILAKELARNPTVLVVNDTVFAHGGLLPIHLNYGLERINMEMAAWMRAEDDVEGGKATPPYIAMGGPQSILWNRTFGQEVFKTQYERYHACSMVKNVLSKLGAKQLVVGHTPQLSGCNCECGGQVWRVDVGMSRGVLNAGPQVLEIDQDAHGESQIRVLRSQSEELTHERIQNGQSRGVLPPPSNSNGHVKRKFFNFEWVSKTIVQVRRVEDGD